MDVNFCSIAIWSRYTHRVRSVHYVNHATGIVRTHNLSNELHLLKRRMPDSSRANFGFHTRVKVTVFLLRSGKSRAVQGPGIEEVDRS
jgi:hypothetical protein